MFVNFLGPGSLFAGFLMCIIKTIYPFKAIIELVTILHIINNHNSFFTPWVSIITGTVFVILFVLRYGTALMGINRNSRTGRLFFYILMIAFDSLFTLVICFVVGRNGGVNKTLTDSLLIATFVGILFCACLTMPTIFCKIVKMYTTEQDTEKPKESNNANVELSNLKSEFPQNSVVINIIPNNSLPQKTDTMLLNNSKNKERSQNCQQFNLNCSDQPLDYIQYSESNLFENNNPCVPLLKVSKIPTL